MDFYDWLSKSRLDLKTPVFDRSGKEWMVSTVLLPLPDPLPYETMVFPAKNGEIDDYFDFFSKQYMTETEARKGHINAVEMVKTWKQEKQ